MIKLNELLQFTVCFTLCRNITVLQFTYVFSLRCFAVSNFILLLSFPACLPVTIWKMKWKLLLHFSWIHHRCNHFFHFTRFNHRSQTGLRLREHWDYGQLHVITLFNKLKIFLKKVNLSLMKWWIYSAKTGVAESWTKNYGVYCEHKYSTTPRNVFFNMQSLIKPLCQKICYKLKVTHPYVQ